MFNVTVANGMGVTGYITDLSWSEEEHAGGGGTSGESGDVLDVKAEYSEILWPWSG